MQHGHARYVADVVADQVARGWDVAVASPTYGQLADWISAEGARHIPWTAGRMPGPSSVLHAVSLARIVEREAPDLVHLHSSSAGLSGRLAVRGRRPTIFQPHAWSFEAVGGPLRAAAAAWERRGARWTSAIVCVSYAERLRGIGAELGVAERLRLTGYLSDAEVERLWMLADCAAFPTRAEGFGLPVVSAHCDYKRPAKYDDVLVVKVRIAELKRASLRFEYVVTREADAQVLATGHTVHACIGPSGKPTGLPESVVKLLSFP